MPLKNCGIILVVLLFLAFHITMGVFGAIYTSSYSNLQGECYKGWEFMLFASVYYFLTAIAIIVQGCTLFSNPSSATVSSTTSIDILIGLAFIVWSCVENFNMPSSCAVKYPNDIINYIEICAWYSIAVCIGTVIAIIILVCVACCIAVKEVVEEEKQGQIVIGYKEKEENKHEMNIV